MAVVLLVHDVDDVARLGPLVLHFARAAEEDLVLLHAERSREEHPATHVDVGSATEDLLAKATAELAATAEVPLAQPEPEEENGKKGEKPKASEEGAAEQEPSPPTSLSLLRLRAEDVVSAVLECLREPTHKAKTSLFVLSHRDAEMRDEHTDTRTLFRRAPCTTMWLRPGDPDPASCPRILVPAGGGPHAVAALKLAHRVGDCGRERVTALFVQPDVGGYSPSVGQRVVDRILKKAGARAEDESRVVVVRGQILAGIAQVVDEGGHDLVLVGASHRGLLRSRLAGTIPGRLLSRTEGPAVGIVRQAIPFAGRARAVLEHLLSGRVPQLERDERVALVERVQSNSHWDFDFVALVCLSTAIASFGLIQDSSAVVIGAMLIAPLMTPLVGIGLALAQANLRLLSSASRAMVNGFLLAFVIGVVLGFVAGDEVTGEMSARGAPGLPDLAVAWISGVAAAYASSRPNLSAALPGVAIAAALVPPTATAGLAIAVGSPNVALGAALLFSTNIVAIVLGSAFALWAVGVRGEHEHGRVGKWVWGAATALGLLSLAVTTPLSIGIDAPVVEVAPPAPSAPLAAAIRARVERDGDARVTTMRGEDPTDPRLLVVRVRTHQPPHASLASELAELTRAHGAPWTGVRVAVELAYESEVPDGEPADEPAEESSATD